MNMTQKEIARQLDMLADRSASRGATPATSKQVWFLANLILKATVHENVHPVEFHTGLSILNFGDCLTKSKASSLISDMVSA